MNICDPVFRHAVDQPDAPAVIEGDNIVSYRELRDRVRKTATALQNLGLSSGDRVGIFLKDNLDHLVSLLSVARMGCIVVPMDWRAKDTEVERLVTAFRPALVLVEPASQIRIDAPTLAVDDAWRQKVQAAEAEEDFPSDWHAPYCIALTSGTTGNPKGTILTHGQQLARSMVFWVNVGATRQDRYLSAAPFCFTGTRTCSLFHLINGNTVVLFPPLFTPQEYVDAVNKYRITFIFAVPTIHRWLLKLAPQDGCLLPGVRVLVNMGGPLFAQEKIDIQRRVNPNFYEFYASTGADATTVLTPGEITQKSGSVGRPTLLNEVEIVDDEGHPVARGETGRLRCRGAAVATGFFEDVKDPAGNEMFRQGWFYPGELATMDSDGYVFLKGRASEVIVRSGINVYPDEVEDALLEHAAIVDAAVVGREVESSGEEEVVAFVVTDGSVDQRGLLAYCRNRLTAYKVPRDIIFIDELPKTASGKLKKSELVERFKAAR